IQKDANFPNRQAGIYHKDEAGAPSFADPQMEHHPVDLHFAKNTAQYGIQSAINVATLPFGPGEEIVSGLIASLRGMPVAERLLQASNLLKLAEKHPAIANLLRGAVRGSAEGSVIGAANADEGQRFQGAKQGAEIGGGLGVLGGALSSIHAVVSPDGRMTPTPLREQAGLPKTGTLQQIRHGADVAQPGAKAAIRQGVQVSAEATGTAAEAGPGLAENIQKQPLLTGHATVLDEHLQTLSKMEKAAYKQVDDAAGFDVKAEKQQLSNDNYKLKQLGNTDADLTQKGKLIEAINDSTDRIKEAETKLQDAGIDPKAADLLHRQRMAGQEFRKVLIKNTSPDGATVKVNGLLTDSKNLRFTKNSDRLEQFFGSPEAANGYMDSLQEMQKLGIRAAKANKIAWMVAKWVGGGLVGGTAAGLGYEALH
ncbi:MAG TPA: hypothetical protein VFQ43_19020, partial [Nitrososphaera sp.]|nr:hypothetical protein [Nitrososphaera sp.]